jgi:RNA polymerase sigma-70 factor, ECF subfamily
METPGDSVPPAAQVECQEAAADSIVVSTDLSRCEESEEYAGIVNMIRRDDLEGGEALCRTVSRPLRMYLLKQVGEEYVEDLLQEVLLEAVQAIRNGNLKDPRSLLAYVMGIARNKRAEHLRCVVYPSRLTVTLDPESMDLRDSRTAPDEGATFRQHVEIMGLVLEKMSLRDREVLKKFYLLRQTKEQICKDLGLTFTQFRLLKSRAKNRFLLRARNMLHFNIDT